MNLLSCELPLRIVVDRVEFSHPELFVKRRKKNGKVELAELGDQDGVWQK